MLIDFNGGDGVLGAAVHECEHSRPENEGRRRPAGRGLEAGDFDSIEAYETERLKIGAASLTPYFTAAPFSLTSTIMRKA